MKISKAYRPEVLVSKGREPNPLITDPYLDVTEERLVSTNGRALVALPVDTEKGERSRYLACNLLEAARSFGEEEIPAEIDDQEVKEYGVLWPTAQERQFVDWKKLVPKFTRGSKGTVSFALDPDLLAKVARAMGVGGVVLTIELGRPEDRPSPVVVQPFGEEREELGLLMPLDMEGGAEPQLGEGQICPECRRILAAGAACPEHGHAAPTVVDRGGTGVAAAVQAFRDAIPPGTTVTARVGDGPVHILAGPSKPGALVWRELAGKKGVVEADLPGGGSFRVGPDSRGSLFALWRIRPKLRGLEVIGMYPDAARARKAAERKAAEEAGDSILRNAGSGELTKADTKGDAVARKPRKGGRRG